jgi:hypothetical protein
MEYSAIRNERPVRLRLGPSRCWLRSWQTINSILARLPQRLAVMIDRPPPPAVPKSGHPAKNSVQVSEFQQPRIPRDLPRSIADISTVDVALDRQPHRGFQSQQRRSKTASSFAHGDPQASSGRSDLCQTIDVEEITCAELVERVTDYLEDVLKPADIARIHAHLPSCDSCKNYLSQVRVAIRITSCLPNEEMTRKADAEILNIYRKLLAERGSRD